MLFNLTLLQCIFFWAEISTSASNSDICATFEQFGRFPQILVDFLKHLILKCFFSFSFPEQIHLEIEPFAKFAEWSTKKIILRLYIIVITSMGLTGFSKTYKTEST